MAVGRAREKGIQVPGLSGLLSAGRFEEHAGSKLHRPNQYTFTSRGKSLQVRFSASLLTCMQSSQHTANAGDPLKITALHEHCTRCTICTQQQISKGVLYVQAVTEDSFADGDDSHVPLAAPQPQQHAAVLTDDPNDDFCRVCGFGVSIL